MLRWPLVLLVLSTACSNEPDPVVIIDDPGAAIERVCATLDEAARLAGGGDKDGALSAWYRAHAQFDAELTPWLDQEHGPGEALALDYDLGRVRREMGRRRGHPRDLSTAFATKLRALTPTVPAT